MDPVHIRTADQTATLCGAQGGTISARHYRENPSNHLSALTLCAACVRVADVAKIGVPEESIRATWQVLLWQRSEHDRMVGLRNG